MRTAEFFKGTQSLNICVTMPYFARKKETNYIPLTILELSPSERKYYSFCSDLFHIGKIGQNWIGLF
jgi:hypothetical protein